MVKKTGSLFLVVCFLLAGVAAAACPEYIYHGDAAVAGPNDVYDSLDGTWNHNNGSD